MNIIKKSKTAALLIFSILLNFFLSAQDSHREEGFDAFANLSFVGFTFSGETLSRSFDWIDSDNEFVKNCPLFFIVAPALSGGVSYTKNQNLLTFINSANLNLSPVGTGSSFDTTLCITPLFSLNAGAHIESAWNYGTYLTSLGVYDPVHAEYDQIDSLSEFSYGVKFEAAATIPLPKSNLLQLSYGTDYIAFSGADDGEPWTCYMQSDCANGWRYKTSAMLSHMFSSKKLKFAGLSFSVDGRYNGNDDYDKIYRDSEPGHTDYTVALMTHFKMSEKQSLMISADVKNKRQFEKDESDFDTEETLLQKYKRDVWRFNNIFLLWNIKLY